MLLINLGIQNIVIINNKLINNCHQVSGKNGGTGGHLHFNLLLLSILGYKCHSSIIATGVNYFIREHDMEGMGLYLNNDGLHISKLQSTIDSRISP